MRTKTGGIRLSFVLVLFLFYSNVKFMLSYHCAYHIIEGEGMDWRSRSVIKKIFVKTERSLRCSFINTELIVYDCATISKPWLTVQRKLFS